MEHETYDAHPPIEAVGDAAWNPRRIIIATTTFDE